MAKSPYKLSRELVGHTGDVRDITVTLDGSIVSTSRDKTAILWTFQDGLYVGNTVMSGHNNFVSSVCVINPSEKFPNGLIVTGSNDSHIFIYNLGETQPLHKIKAHENTVCCLKSSKIDRYTFHSSSWDITAKLWNLRSFENSPETTYIGHSAAVWCVCDLPNGYVVTGSADKTVLVYLRDGHLLHKLTGHTNCVRDIEAIKENEFLTCANDAVIKHWSSVTGDCLGDYYGHSNYIYSLSTVPDGSLVVSSGEDKTIRVWCNAEIEQTITLPAQSVWCVKLLPNEDIVCGASDGVVRIFTSNPERYADSETIQRFEESVTNKEKSDQDVGDLKLDKIPDSSALSIPGKKDGETKLIKENGSVKAYSWSQKDLKWNIIGDVMGSNPSNSGKKLYNGMEYDYIFSVDIQDGVPPLKLPYNNGQDPWHAAQKFIDDNDLSQMFLEHVANFIIKNSTPASVENTATSSEFYDPFTGGNRYIPSSSSQNTSVSIPATITQPSNMPATSITSSYIPLANYLKLEQANLTAIHDKLKEFNSKQEVEPLSISEDNLAYVVKLATNQSQEAIDAGAINNLISLLKWPDTIVFPVLDVARLAVLQKNVNDTLCTDKLISLLRPHLANNAIASNQMLTFRLLANMFNHETGEKLGLEYRNEFLKLISELPSLGNKNNQVAMSTYILNLVLAVNKTNDSACKIQVLSVICSLLGLFKEIEAVFRVFVAVGTLIITANSNERQQIVNIVRQSENALNILQVASTNTDKNAQKLVSVSKKIIGLIV